MNIRRRSAGIVAGVVVLVGGLAGIGTAVGAGTSADPAPVVLTGTPAPITITPSPVTVTYTPAPVPTATVTVPGPTQTVTVTPSPSASPTSTPSSTPTVAPTTAPPTTAPPTTAPPTTQPPASSVLDRNTLGVYGGNFAASKATSFYLQTNSACPTADAEAMLKKAGAVNLDLSSNGDPTYATALVNGNATVSAWMDRGVACAKTLSDFAVSLHNGSYVIAYFWHEAQAKESKGVLSGDSATIGKAQEIGLLRLAAGAPNAIKGVWLVGGQDGNANNPFSESVALAQLSPVPPDIITMDPYNNHSCTGNLGTTVGPDIAWLKKQPVFNGRTAITETGMPNTCTDAQLAAFYGGWPAQVSAIEASTGVQVAQVIMFDSDGGQAKYPHTLDSRPIATAALTLSLLTQAAS